MNPSNEDPKQPDSKELPKQQASACCGSGCECETGPKPGKARWVVGTIVLAAAGVLAVRGMVNINKGSTQASAAGFANPVASETAAGGPATNSGGAAAASEKSMGTSIGRFSELNAVAAKTDAVFVFLPGREGTSANVPSAPINAAARAIEAKGLKCSLFTLQADSPDYDQIAKEISVPGVIVLVKGNGMRAVSGEITEAKLLQGYIAASSAGGCCPTEPSACCPK